MGMRAQVAIHDDLNTDKAVYLYTHWGSEGLPALIARVFQRDDLRTDPEYLARQVFCEMVKGDVDGGLSFGIGTEEHGDLEYEPIHIYADGGDLRVEHRDFAWGRQGWIDTVERGYDPRTGDRALPDMTLNLVNKETFEVHATITLPFEEGSELLNQHTFTLVWEMAE